MEERGERRWRREEMEEKDGSRLTVCLARRGLHGQHDRLRVDGRSLCRVGAAIDLC